MSKSKIIVPPGPPPFKPTGRVWIKIPRRLLRQKGSVASTANAEAVRADEQPPLIAPDQDLAASSAAEPPTSAPTPRDLFTDLEDGVRPPALVEPALVEDGAAYASAEKQAERVPKPEADGQEVKRARRFDRRRGLLLPMHDPELRRAVFAVAEGSSFGLEVRRLPDERKGWKAFEIVRLTSSDS